MNTFSRIMSVESFAPPLQALNCDASQTEEVGLSALQLITLLCMMSINLAVILGNTLVILSVFVYGKLRTVTNFFIVSLAVADLLLGLTILPYSLTQTVANTWYFGEMWCMGWLVIDVWLSTASILNLVAISLDRYLAITRPIQYRSLMTAKRAKLLIAGAWVVSFCICLPPLLGWKQPGPWLVQVQDTQTAAAAGRISRPMVNPQALAIAKSESRIHPSLNFSKQPSTRSSNEHRTHMFARRKRFTLVDSKRFSTSGSSENRSPVPRLIDWTVPSLNQKSDHLFSTASPNGLDYREIDYAEGGDYLDGDNIDETLSQASSNIRNLADHKSIYPTNVNNSQCKQANVSDSQVQKGPLLQCVLFDSCGYVTYSALGSFFIPMLVMVFFYWRIYSVASETTRALNRGYISGKQTANNQAIVGSGSSYSGNGLSERDSKLTLRVHRGYMAQEHNTPEKVKLNSRKKNKKEANRVNLGQGMDPFRVQKRHGRLSAEDEPKRESSSGASETDVQSTKRKSYVQKVACFCKVSSSSRKDMRKGEQRFELKIMNQSNSTDECNKQVNKNRTLLKPQLEVSNVDDTGEDNEQNLHCSNYELETSSLQGSNRMIVDQRNAHRRLSADVSCIATMEEGNLTPAGSRKCSTPSNASTVITTQLSTDKNYLASTSSSTKSGLWSRAHSDNKRCGPSSGRFQAKRFIAETKAAKTVGIIVGCFIFCWVPFFSVYLTRGICDDKNCVPDILLSVFVWLGYVNSALNPIIYGMFSKEFRRAFRNILCKCKFGEDTGVSSLIRQIHLPNLFDEDD